MTIPKPTKTVIPLSTGLAWQPDPGAVYQEKLDGRFATKRWRGHLLAGELLADGDFVAFDVLATHGGHIRNWQLSLRWGVLMAMRGDLLLDDIEVVPTANDYDAGHGGKFLERILKAGGEGVVKKSLSTTWYEPMLAAKRLETFLCTVTSIGDAQSVGIAIDGQDCGRVGISAGKLDRIRVGSVLKVEGFSRTARGMIREPRLCKDSETSWLIKY